MAISVNPITGEITIPRADMPVIQVSPEIRSLDTQQFFSDLKDFEASADGIPWTDTQRHAVQYTISGIVYTEAIEIIPPYFVTFEDGQYSVRLDGSNNNIIDVATANQVRLIGGNSAGLISPAQLDAIALRVFDLWKNEGCEVGNPMTVTPTRRYTQDGSVDMTLSGDGVTTTTVERNP